MFLSQIRLSVVCLSVTLVHPTQEVEPFGNISSPLCVRWPSSDLLAKLYEDRLRETTPPGALNARGGFGPVEGYIS